MKSIWWWWWTPISLVGLFIIGILMTGWWTELVEVNVPTWSPNSDPVESMSHGDGLVCWKNSQAHPPVNGFGLTVNWMPGASGDHLFLFPSSRGECGILKLSLYGLNPVSIQLTPHIHGERRLYQVSTWSTAGTWVTTDMTEEGGNWVANFNFTDHDHQRPVITVLVE